MARIKAAVRRFPAAERRKGKQIRPFRIKEILQQQKTVVIKKKKWTGDKNNKSREKIKVFLEQK